MARLGALARVIVWVGLALLVAYEIGVRVQLLTRPSVAIAAPVQPPPVPQASDVAPEYVDAHEQARREFVKYLQRRKEEPVK